MKPISIINILKGLLGSLAILTLLAYLYNLPLFEPLRLKLAGQKTVADRLSEYEEPVNNRLLPLFQQQGLQYPPPSLTLLFIKSKKTLSVFAPGTNGNPKFVKTYNVIAASGKPGPKLREGDYQVPEGIYSIESLNPNSSYHLSLRVNYPNAKDRRNAEAEGRNNLGTDIMIHGNAGSMGCIALENSDIEELFILAARSKYTNWKLVLSPVDFRAGEAAPNVNPQIPWLAETYNELAKEMALLE